MRPAGHGRASTLAVVAALTLLLVTVAAASRTRLFAEAEPPLPVEGARLLIDFSTYLAFALVLISAAILTWALWPRDLGGVEPPRRSLLSLVGQVVASTVTMAAAALVLVQFRLHNLRGQPVPAGAGAGRQGPLDQLARPVPQAPAAFDWTAAGLAAVTLVLVGVVAARRLRRARRARAREGALARELRQVVEQTLDDLRLDVDPRRAVILAYARMERVLGAGGAPRRQAETPVEYLDRALRQLEVPAAQAARLTELFEEARFSTHEVSPAMREEAIGCLGAVRGALAT